MSKNISSVNDASFESDVLQSTNPVLVDFWAEWCGPCKMISPILDEIANDYQDKIKVVKVNVEESKAIPAKYGIKGIPTLILFKDGQVQATKVGAITKSQLAAFLDSHL